MKSSWRLWIIDIQLCFETDILIGILGFSRDYEEPRYLFKYEFKTGWAIDKWASHTEMHLAYTLVSRLWRRYHKRRPITRHLLGARILLFIFSGKYEAGMDVGIKFMPSFTKRYEVYQVDEKVENESNPTE